MFSGNAWYIKAVRLSAELLCFAESGVDEMPFADLRRFQLFCRGFVVARRLRSGLHW